MAVAVADGAKEAGADVDLLSCADIGNVSLYDAAALGCPAMGAEELEGKCHCLVHMDRVTANGYDHGESDVQKRVYYWRHKVYLPMKLRMTLR